MKQLIVGLIIIAISIGLSIWIATSDLPFWIKFMLLR